jgi:hypothetical protein
MGVLCDIQFDSCDEASLIVVGPHECFLMYSGNSPLSFVCPHPLSMPSASIYWCALAANATRDIILHISKCRFPDTHVGLRIEKRFVQPSLCLVLFDDRKSIF